MEKCDMLRQVVPWKKNTSYVKLIVLTWKDVICYVKLYVLTEWRGFMLPYGRWAKHAYIQSNGPKTQVLILEGNVIKFFVGMRLQIAWPCQYEMHIRV